MNDVEITGKNLDEALQLAAEELGVAPEQVAHEVIEEGGKGFLGLGQSRVVIRAWATQSEEPEIEVESPSLDVADADIPEESDAMQDKRAEALMDIMNHVLSAMQLDARPVLQSSTEEEILVNFEGPDVAILIGKQGHTLDALQYLAGIVINRRFDGRVRVTLDAEGYRKRHQQMLETRARELAASVSATGQEAVLDPLPARDRRIIHLFLADNPDVETYSEGDGEDRRLVITPKK